MTTPRYTKIDDIPFPIAPNRYKRGLTGADGQPLHGAYERRIGNGLVRRVAINNGRKIPGYDYVYPEFTPVLPAARHNNANLLLCGGYAWEVPAGSEPPLVYPGTVSEPGDPYPTFLWKDQALFEQVVAGAKPAATIGTPFPEIAETWCSRAIEAGRAVEIHPRLSATFGWPYAVHAALPGRLVTDDEIEVARAEYAQLVPGYEFSSELFTGIRSLSGELFVSGGFADHTQGGHPILLGLLLGYPPATTVSNFSSLL